MVDKDSATLVIHGADETQLLVVDADHSSICKLDSIDSQPVCRNIAAALKRSLSERREPLGQQTKAPAAGPATEHDPPEPRTLRAPSFTSMPGIKVLYSPADAIVECVYPPSPK